MTPERAKELLPVIQAFAEGKQIQVQDIVDKKWRNVAYPTFDSHSAYRIKPEVVRYRRYVYKVEKEFTVKLLNSNLAVSPSCIEQRYYFVRWIDTDWVEEEV